MDRSLQVAFRALALSLTLPLLVFVISEMLPRSAGHATEPRRFAKVEPRDAGPIAGRPSRACEVPSLPQVQSRPLEVKPVVVEPVEVRVDDVPAINVNPVAVKAVSVKPVSVERVHVAPVAVTPVEVAPVKVAPVRVDTVHVAPVPVENVRVDPVRVAPVQVSPIQVELRISGDEVLQSLMAGKGATGPFNLPSSEPPMAKLEESLRRMETEQREMLTKLQQSQLAATQNQLQAEQLKLQQQALTQAEHDRKLDRLDQRVADLQSGLQIPVMTMGGTPSDRSVSDAPGQPKPKTIESTVPQPPMPEPASAAASSRTAAPLREERRFSIVMHDVELSECLAKISELSGKNIVIREPVCGRVTVSLNDVTVHQALATLLRPNGCLLEVDRGVLYVSAVASRVGVGRGSTKTLIRAAAVPGTHSQ